MAYWLQHLQKNGEIVNGYEGLRALAPEATTQRVAGWLEDVSKSEGQGRLPRP